MWSAWTWQTELLVSVSAQLEANQTAGFGPGAPRRSMVVPGGPAVWDDCCDDDEGGTLWVRTVRVWPSKVFPNKDLDAVPCRAGLAVQLGIGIVRCVKAMDDRGNPVTPTEYQEYARVANCDMAAIHQGIVGIPDYDEATAGVLAVDQWTPLGESGNCAGGEWTIWVEACLQCPDPEGGSS